MFPKGTLEPIKKINFRPLSGQTAEHKKELNEEIKEKFGDFKVIVFFVFTFLSLFHAPSPDDPYNFPTVSHGISLKACFIHCQTV